MGKPGYNSLLSARAGEHLRPGKPRIEHGVHARDGIAEADFPFGGQFQARDAM
jgi:hypothetical protein